MPLPPAARVQVATGDAVQRGQCIATAEGAADVLAPASGVAAGVVQRRVATANQPPVDCLLITNTDSATADEPLLLPPPASMSPAVFLRAAGIVGLGGAGFPTWRKWRPQLQMLIVNAIESDPLSSCDSALLAAAGAQKTLAAVRKVAAFFAARPLLALPAHTNADFMDDKVVVRCPAGYADGSERLLVDYIFQHAKRLPPPPPARAVLADYGIISLNIATVFAVAAALTRRQPLTSRVVSVHAGGQVANVRAVFGTPVRAVLAAALGRASTDSVCLEDEQLAADAVLAATTPPLFAGVPPHCGEPAASACIRCGDCAPACPVGLHPMRLHHHYADSHYDAMQAEGLHTCILCRRCDDVCPSNIALTRQFAQAKSHLAAAARRNRQQQHWQRLYDRHQQQVAAATPPAADRAALRAQVAAHRHRSIS